MQGARETTPELREDDPGVAASAHQRALGDGRGHLTDAMVANLFLHHFEDDQLTGLLRAASTHARLFVAIEPRRSALGLLFSRLLWCIGCNGVTRHDAVISVRAGFVGSELSKLWPGGPGWRLEERRGGWFSHLFIAHQTR